MIASQRPLPEFEIPPVDEVVISVQFPAMPEWKIPHFGLYWHSIIDAYPKCEAHPPLPNNFEDFSSGRAAFAQSAIRMSTDPNDIRCWFLAEGDNELIQIQPTHFIRNWRKVLGDEQYPRYSVLRPAFEKEWQHFCRFLSDNRINIPEVRECEITYINNIARGEGWQDFSDLPKVTPLWSGSHSEDYLSGPETVNIGMSYKADEFIGRLRINLKHILRLTDSKEFLQLTLSAKGKPSSTSDSDILSWMDEGRNWIVRAFADITTPEMHKIWRRQR